MAFFPQHPLTVKTANCPYCFDGHVRFDQNSNVFYCSHCSIIVDVVNYPKK